MRTDREFNLLCSSAAHNEFAAGAMSLMHGLSRRFWYIHYKQAADMPLTAKLHADIARAIADKDEERAANASDRLLDVIEKFTRATVSTGVSRTQRLQQRGEQSCKTTAESYCRPSAAPARPSQRSRI